MMRPNAKVQKAYLYPKPVDFRKAIDGLAALVELEMIVSLFEPAIFVFLNRARNRVKILYWERNGFCRKRSINPIFIAWLNPLTICLLYYGGDCHDATQRQSAKSLPLSQAG